MPDPSKRSEYRDLGMDRRIDRRDFLNGVAVGVGALSSALQPRPASAATRAQSTQSPAPDAYPPRRIGLRGQHASAVEAFGAIDSGKFAQFPGIDVDTRETYDLVIVGGGLSGLAAAYFWQRALGANQRVLVLDNHDDFGGHAKRNEFVYNGRTFLSFGGTMSIATPYPYSYMSKRLVRGPRHRRDEERGGHQPRVVRHLRPRSEHLLRQGALRRGSAGRGHRPAAVGSVLR